MATCSKSLFDIPGYLHTSSRGAFVWQCHNRYFRPPMPIRSMTGFARVSRALPAGELTLSLKTVNHRGLDLHFHMPAEFDAVEPALRNAVRKRVLRGHVQVQVY